MTSDTARDACVGKPCSDAGKRSLLNIVKATASSLLAQARGTNGKYILKLIVLTRLACLVTGIVARSIFPSAPELFNPVNGTPVSYFSSWIGIDIWGCWDSYWLHGIAIDGYANPIRLNFFPLYPLLAQYLGYIVSDAFIAGLLVSDVCMVGSCYLLYKVARLELGSEKSASAVAYLLLFPTSFILNGFFTESLFLFLTLVSYYCARQGKWALCGAAGFFMALTKSLGAIMAVPMLLEYLRQRRYSLKKLQWNVLFLALYPAGLGLYMLYNHAITGDFIAFAHYQQSIWGFNIENLWTVIIKCFLFQDAGILTIIAVAAFTIVFLTKNMDLPRYAACLVLLITPFVGGITASMPRYMLVMFPLYLLMGERIRAGWKVYAVLVPVQLFLMFTWALRAPVII
jgi:hypothetical protein